MATEQGGIGSKITTLVGAKVVREGFRKGWTAATGDEPPVPEHPDTSVVQAVLWTALSAAAVAVAQLLIRRRFAARAAARPATDT